MGARQGGVVAQTEALAPALLLWRAVPTGWRGGTRHKC